MKQKEQNWDIYNDFQLKKPFGLQGLCKTIQRFQGLYEGDYTLPHSSVTQSGC